jgi:hypothetical protein
MVLVEFLGLYRQVPRWGYTHGPSVLTETILGCSFTRQVGGEVVVAIFKALVASLSDCGRGILTIEQCKLTFCLLVEAGWYGGNKKQKAEEQEIYLTQGTSNRLSRYVPGISERQAQSRTDNTTCRNFALIRALSQTSSPTSCQGHVSVLVRGRQSSTY